MIVPRHRLLFWVAMLLPVAALAVLTPDVLPLTAGLAAVLAVIAFGDAVFGWERKQSVRVALPEVVRASVGRPLAIAVSFHAEDPAVRTLQVGLALPEGLDSDEEGLRVSLPPGGGLSQVDWPCRARERGRFVITRCHYEVDSPLGLWGARGASECRSEVRVYPNLAGDRKRLAALFLRRGHIGSHTQRQVGQGREFEKLREYIPGDSYEEIHWKATAKRGRPITKVFQVERTREIYVLIDSSRLSGREFNGEPVLERFIAAALMIGLVAEQQGDLFGVLTFGDRVRRFIRAGGGRAHYHACRDAIYAATPEPVSPDFGELFSFVRLRLRRRALLLVLTDLGDPLLAEQFQQRVELVCRQHVVMVTMMKQPGLEPVFSAPDVQTPDDLYRRLAGHLMWQGLREVGQGLHRHGVRLALTDNERLTAELVSQYMSVKARQLL